MGGWCGELNWYLWFLGRGGIKKARGSFGLEICTFHAIIAVLRGQGQGLRDWGR